MIVPVAIDLKIEAFTGADKTTVKFSSASLMSSATTFTIIVFETSFGAKLIVLEETALKSSAGLPVPSTRLNETVTVAEDA